MLHQLLEYGHDRPIPPCGPHMYLSRLCYLTDLVAFWYGRTLLLNNVLDGLERREPAFAIFVVQHVVDLHLHFGDLLEPKILHVQLRQVATFLVTRERIRKNEDIDRGGVVDAFVIHGRGVGVGEEGETGEYTLHVELGKDFEDLGYGGSEEIQPSAVLSREDGTRVYCG